MKARDFVDVYLISREYDIAVAKLEPQIVEKTAFVLDMYEKYRRNLKNKMEAIGSEDMFVWGREKELLLQEIDENEFYRFVERLNNDLKSIAVKVL